MRKGGFHAAEIAVTHGPVKHCSVRSCLSLVNPVQDMFPAILEKDDFSRGQSPAVVPFKTYAVLAVPHERIHAVTLDDESHRASSGQSLGYLSEKDIVRDNKRSAVRHA